MHAVYSRAIKPPNQRIDEEDKQTTIDLIKQLKKFYKDVFMELTQDEDNDPYTTLDWIYGHATIHATRTGDAAEVQSCMESFYCTQHENDWPSWN